MGIERINEFWPSWKPVSLIGKGANGEVYKCIHEEMGVRTFSAIKVIKISSAQVSTLSFDTFTTRSFCRNLINECINEINIMLTLKSCPNIVAIEDFRVIETVKDDEWEIFIRMELLTCLTDYLKDRILTQNEIIKLGTDLCSALEICHNKNIMHRDIKPANIFVNNFGDFKLGDFGIARTLEMATAGFSQKGTMTYVAPEVMQSNTYSEVVDIYSLGLVLYQCANNNRLPFIPPFGEYTPAMQSEAIKTRLNGYILPPASNVDEKFNNTLRTACAYSPTDRFGSALQMKNALISLSNSSSEATEQIVYNNVRQPVNTNIYNKKNKERNFIKITILAVCIIAVICAIITEIFLFSGNRNDDINNIPETVHTTDATSTTEIRTDSPTVKTTELETTTEKIIIEQIINDNIITDDTLFSNRVDFDQKTANIYVSNITEAGMNTFSGTPTVDEMLKLTINHSILNHNPSVSGIKYGNYYSNSNNFNLRINTDYADRLSTRFFGIDINASTLDRPFISSGHIYGNSANVFSQGVAFVRSVYCDDSAEKYKLSFSVFMTGETDETEFYSLTPFQAEFYNTFTYRYDGYIILQKYRSSGTDAYKIIEFSKTE
ncbi:MAG: serine/threonine protein kinase [Clostridia bacterium]|nr:serine/threonine protein kinase [Clostridia bacterium]